MSPIRVLLVDDHKLFRQGTAAALTTLGGIDVVGEAEDGLAAVELARNLRPDVVLMDLSLPGIDGIEATGRILRESPDSRVVVLTYHDDETRMITALRAGARGYLLKTVAPEELWAHVRAVMAGETPISGSLTLRLINTLEQRHLLVPDEAGAVAMTGRERELIDLVARGFTNREIGKTLFMSESTVKVHLRNLLRKLHLNSRAELIVHAARTGAPVAR